MTNYEVFGTDNDDKRIPADTIELWSSNKDSIVFVTRDAVASTSDAQASPSAPTRMLRGGFTGAKGSAKAALDDMQKLLDDLSQQVCLPIADERAQERAISKLMAPGSSQS